MFQTTNQNMFFLITSMGLDAPVGFVNGVAVAHPIHSCSGKRLAIWYGRHGQGTHLSYLNFIAQMLHGAGIFTYMKGSYLGFLCR